MSSEVSRRQILSGLFWRYGERTCAQGVQFIVSIVIARILSPEDYGYVGLVTVFISILTVFVQSGLGNALVQKKDADEVDFSSVFFVNVALGVLLCIVLQIVAPVIASFYQAKELLTPVIRVLAFSLILASINSVQNAYVSRRMIFKKFFFATIIGTIISAFTGISAAYAGLGLWALVIQQLTNQTIDTIVLWLTVKWRPHRAFSLQRVKGLFSYGWKILCSSLIDTIYNNMYSLIIGKFYTSEELGYYNRGKNIPNLVITNINSSIQAVMFPAYSKVQSDLNLVKQMVQKSIRVGTYLIFPCMVGLGVVAKPLTVVLLTEKWLPAVIFMQFCCFIYAFWPIHTANLQAISAIGRSDVFLGLEIIKKVLGVLFLIFTLRHGLIVMMIGRCVNTVIASVLNAFPNKRLLNYSYTEQLKDIMPNLLLSFVMGLLVYAVNFIPVGYLLQLVIQIFVGIFSYLGFSILFKVKGYGYVKSVLNEAKNTIRKK